jgi:hypothetical protein
MDLGHPGGRGTPVLNIAPGTVARVLHDDSAPRAFSGYGNAVVVHHPEDDTWALYGHMNRTTVTQGQQVNAGDQLGEMGNSSNRKFPGMGVHLHLELRHRRPNGRPPFPGPYPQSPQQLYNNIDPRRWLASKGLTFSNRGAFEVQPRTLMAKTSSIWSGMGGVDLYPLQTVGDGWQTPETSLAGVDPYPDHRVGDGWMVPETALAGGEDDIENTYEPPKNFDRDVYFGLAPVEWAAVGTGVLVLTGAGVAAFIRSRR